MSSRSNSNASASAAARRFITVISPAPVVLMLLSWTALAADVEVRGKHPRPTIEVTTTAGESVYAHTADTLPVLLESRGRCGKRNSLESAHLAVSAQDLDKDLAVPVNSANRSYSADEGKAWRTHQIDLPIRILKLWTGQKTAENVPRPSKKAWEVCNAELQRRDAAGRAAMLENGVTILLRDALTARFSLICEGHGGAFDDTGQTQAGIDVGVRCQPMVKQDSNAARRKKPTTTAAPPRHGKPMPPAIESVKLRVEVSEHQACPDSVRLVGSITARAPSHGSYLFIGDHWLSPQGNYDFDAKGHRSVVATRRIDWDKVPKGIAAGPGAVRTLQGFAQLNVQPANADKVHSSERVPFKATCKAPVPARIKASAAASPDQAATMTAIAMAESGGGTASGQATGKRQHQPPRARSYVDATAATSDATTNAPADLATIDMIRLGNKDMAWGSNKMTLDDSAGGEAMEDGRCRFRYRFEVINQGDAPAGGFVTRLRVNEEVVAQNSSSGMVGDVRTVIAGEAALAPGKQLIYVHIDDDGEVAEKDEKNNLRRIGVDISCGA